MDVSGVSNAGYTQSKNNSHITTIDDDNGVKRTTGNSNLGMSDFMTLMAAQMSNQDMMNPVSDTDFIAQMAQFSALEGVNTLQEYVLSSYAVSYVGKHVIISHQDENTKQLETIYGQVERVTFMSGQPKVVVDGKEYDLYTVMEISNTPVSAPIDPTSPTDTTGDAGNTGDTGDVGDTGDAGDTGDGDSDDATEPEPFDPTDE